MKKRLFRTLVCLSFTLNIVVLTGSILVVQKRGGPAWLIRKLTETFGPEAPDVPGVDYRGNRLSVLLRLPVRPDDIVFLGDSILYSGEWHELLNDPRAKNRAVSGDDTQSLLKRLEPIVAGRPRHVVLLCGINNFQQRVPLARTTDEYARIVTTIASRSPGTDIWMIALLPVNIELYRKWIAPYNPDLNMPPQAEIQAFNTSVKGLASRNPRVHFVELPELLEKTGQLRDSYTMDGLHLNGPGLEKVAERFKNLLELRRSEP